MGACLVLREMYINGYEAKEKKMGSRKSPGEYTEYLSVHLGRPV